MRWAGYLRRRWSGPQDLCWAGAGAWLRRKLTLTYLHWTPSQCGSCATLCCIVVAWEAHMLYGPACLLAQVSASCLAICITLKHAVLPATHACKHADRLSVLYTANGVWVTARADA